MTERPIIFSAPIMRAILEGRKFQTRRVVHPPKWSTGVDDMELGDDGVYAIAKATGCLAKVPAPYAVGDLLWVRETWGWAGRSKPAPMHPHFLRYAAECAQSGKTWGWRPSIHMPRWASRITLEVTAVKVERLQEISDQDAMAEGIFYQEPTDEDREWFKKFQEENSRDPNEVMEGVWTSGVRDTWGPTPKSAFQMLWQHIHGPGAWAANPWVAAVTFDRVKP